MRTSRRRVNPRSVTNVVGGGEAGDIHQKTVTSPDALRVETQEMRHAAEACRHVEGIGVPEVVSMDLDVLTLSTAYISGDSLFNFLWNSTSCLSLRPLHVGRAESIGATIGSWLREYHRSSSVSTVNTDEWNELAASGCRKLARVRTAKASFLSSDEVTQIHNYFTTEAPRCEMENARSYHVQVHGDFTPTNLLITPTGHLRVLDFADSRIGEPGVDCVRLAHDLWAAGQIGQRRKKILGALENSFWRAYGTTASPLQHEFLKCWNSVCFLASYASSSHLLGFTGKLAAWRLAQVHLCWLRSRVTQGFRA